jgi:23S rRNA (cytidine1920-2'-O)/16S rRNA (cytidine1409-2'-O)-methyltransferase
LFYGERVREAQFPPARQRLDRLLVARGFFDTRNRARAAIEAGRVRVDGRVAARPAAPTAADAEIVAEPAHPFVSRGGVKLAHAFAHFGIDPGGRICLDVGCSTGGFTDLLLQRGARFVHAVDVGTDQFHPRLRGDARIALREGCDIRALLPGDLLPTPDLAVVDVSFISAAAVLPTVAALLATGDLIVLAKPQFEVGRGQIGKGGIVKDAAAQRSAVAQVAATMIACGFPPSPAIASPITGGDGNAEFLLHGRRPGPDRR